MQHLQPTSAGGINFGTRPFLSSTRLFAVPFFHLPHHDYIHFGRVFPPGKLSFILLDCLYILDFTTSFNTGICFPKTGT
jgi:hypothetical protein